MKDQNRSEELSTEEAEKQLSFTEEGGKGSWELGEWESLFQEYRKIGSKWTEIGKILQDR